MVQNLKIARSRGFIFPEAFRLTLVKGIVRIKNVELRPYHQRSDGKEEVSSRFYKRSQLYILYSDDSLDKCQTKSFGKYETSASGILHSRSLWCVYHPLIIFRSGRAGRGF